MGRDEALPAVSLPKLRDVPGRLLLMVHGITHIGIRKAAKFGRSFWSLMSEWYA